MLSKIFSFGSRKTGKKHSDVETDTADEIHATKRPFPHLAQDEIRVLVFKDDDRKGKTLLFDSKALPNDVNQQDVGQNRGSDTDQGCKRLSGGPKAEPKGNKSPMQRPKLQHPRPSHDAKMLGEMIFGSVAMTYKGQTVKVHEIRTPHQLLLTNVFAVKPRIVMPNCCDGSDYLSTSSQVDSVLDESTRIEPDCASLSSQNSFSKEDSILGTSSKPMAVPGSSPFVVIDADGDSGFTVSVESTSYLEENLSSLFMSASSSCGSYHRRLHRSHVTSIDHSFGRKSEESSEEITPLMRRRPKLGVGIIFALGDNEEKSRALQGFFFAHFPLFELHVKRLRLAVENACFLKTKSFSSQVVEAVQAFRENMHNLLAAPRLKEPVWLNMMTHSSHRSHLCEKFMVQLVECLRIGNSRATNFFMAAVLTAVLQYHLAWVSTVMPAGAAPSRAYLDKHSSKTLDLLAQSHPYNPLWAQLGDLYGAIGFPLRVARTVVVGKDSKLVEQVLNILSYFIRCTEVFEHVQKKTDDSKDVTHDTVSDFGDSICSQCGNKSLAESEISGKTCNLTTETGICSKCKQNCDGKCKVPCDVNNKEDKESLREQILTQLQVTNGLMHCAKCSAKINSSSLEKLGGVEILQSNCTCDKIANGGVRKELKHFIKDVNLFATTNHHCSSFQCYCCKDSTKVDQILSGKETKFKCYCESECDSGKCQEKQDFSTHACKEHLCTKCLEKLHLSLQKCKDEQHTQTNDSLERIAKLSQAVQSQDIVSDCNGHMDSRISETDSCVSDDTDTASVRSSVLEKCADVEETIASYGRSGSADSGIHQSPLNSPCAQRPVDFPNVISCQGEDNQIPEELALHRIENVNCCPDPNSKSDEWRSFNNFGRSMFAGIVDSYVPDLVLQGVQENNFRLSLSTDLKLALQHSVVDDPVSEAVCIIANTDKWTCEVVSVKKNRKQAASDHVHVQQVEVSNLVFTMLSSLSGLWDIKMSAEFCLMHLEDKLKEIYLKSKVITERLRDRRKALTRDDLTKMLSVDDNDVPLLLAVASTHSPQSMSLVS